MEDILASIRRILSEDEAAAADPAPHVNMPHPTPELPAHEDDVLDLDPAMMIQSPAPAADPHQPEPMTELTDMNDEHPPRAFEPAEGAPNGAAPPVQQAAHEGLLAPETANATATSVGTLVRKLAAERNTPVYRGGPTVEDLMRDEMRPLIKEWLDANLPPMVERLVRIEIERVVTRATL